ncbi:extracellular solute-binding protein [Zeimonas arvi]|uniref:ABC transporter substrate-binding protein n=1 Tax=Zeimonas arvi TaxID=2498847 RepID=A0A5C8NR61_9BURK|nr:extracellular solute-binding protein [Zeimonas arvi]TXL63822.1 ABC transporter substrate-binding protein [Zeimonas arvi]
MAIVARALAPLLVSLLALLALPAAPSLAAPSLAWGDQPKYPPGFQAFDYVNPQAPKGGTLNLAGYGSFDKLNPFTLRGLAAAGLGMLMFETLAEPSDDEPFTMYGLLAEDMAFAADGLSITFRLNPAARFWNGDPVTAEDVRHSFEVLTGKRAHPRFRQYFSDVSKVVVVDPRTVRFEFRARNHELHMIIGMQLPIFSRKWGEGRPFDEVVRDEPIASGPYRIERTDWGKSITYRRNPDWWARDLNVRRGMFNFDRVVYKYFSDETARLEGFKAGEFDWVSENSAKNWARGHTGRRYASGEILKREFRHSNPAGMQGFVLNTRRPPLDDPRVRQALGLAFDFEWMNRQVFYGQYVRSPSYFTNSEMQARGLPGPDEKALLEAVRGQVPGLGPAVFGEAPMPPLTDPPGSLRDNLRRALALLKEAGWQVADDGRLRDAGGQALSFEILSYSKGLERVADPWARNLAKLGIEARLRVTDPALYQKRIDDFDYDVAIHVYPASPTPGNELLERFSSAAAAQKGSDNVAGVRDPAVDAVIERLLRSRSRAELVTHAKVLDRLLRHGFYLVPHFHAPTHRVAFRNHLAHPDRLPRYYGAEAWLLKTWWSREAQAAGAASDGPTQRSAAR